MEVKNAPVDNIANVIDTLDTLIAPKNVSQWAAITNPAIMRTRSFLGATFKFFFLNLIHIRINPLAQSILYHTNGTASNEMSAPNTAVKPQIKTIT